MAQRLGSCIRTESIYQNPCAQKLCLPLDLDGARYDSRLRYKL